MTGRDHPAERAVLFTRRLILREFERGDAPEVCAMSREPAMKTWLPDQVYADDSAAREVLARLRAQYAEPDPRRAPYVLGICLGASGELIGHAGLSPVAGEVEIGYAVEASRRGEGYAAEAVEAFSEWGMRRFGLRRVLGIAASENVPSWKVLERAGFELVGEAEGVLHGRTGLVRTYERRP